MSVDAETYIVISLMFAVFAAVAAVGSSMVLGAGFERLRAGFDVVRRQSGFFADAIHKLDQRTQMLDAETTKLKSGLSDMGDRVVRVEKQVMFVGDAINSIEHRILQGSPVKQSVRASIRMNPVTVATRPETRQQTVWESPPVPEQSNELKSMQMQSDVMGLMGEFAKDDDYGMGGQSKETKEKTAGITSLMSQYWMGEKSGSVKYH